MTWIGRVLSDRYRLMEVIGRGGHSLVYRGIERTTDREVAVKVLHEGAPQREELEARLLREHDALVALSGTAAPRVHGLLREDSAMCLVMELLRGQDFDEYLADVDEQGLKVDVGTLVELLGPIVQTLAVAHERGIVHRDVKPGNIFVLGRGGPGGVRLLDFGLSTSTSAPRITRDGIVIGSPSYIAPEVWDGIPRSLDQRVDVYSLGVVIFRALAGHVPFRVSSLRDKITAAKTAPRPSLHAARPDLPRAIDGWVGQALAVNRDERFSHVRSLWSALLTTLEVNEEGRRHGSEAS